MESTAATAETAATTVAEIFYHYLRNEMSRSSVSTANQVFLERPNVNVVAIRESQESYTIAKRDIVNPPLVFSAPIAALRISSIHELREQIVQNILARANAHVSQGPQGPRENERQQLANFINQTLMSHQPRTNPLPENVIANLREIDTDESHSPEKCSICLDNFQVGEKIIVLECGHFNHSSCLRRWFSEHNTCTQCRFIPE